MSASATFENPPYRDAPKVPQLEWVCLRKTYERDIEVENVSDVIDVMMKVMNMCGVPEQKTAASAGALHYGMTHFVEILYRIDRWPHKRIRKEDLMHKLGCQGHLSRFEAQLTFAIFKRLFRAYHYKPNFCSLDVRNPQVQVVHGEECRWVHAAKRTAQIYGMFEGLLPTVQGDFERRLNCMYRRLYDRIKIRLDSMAYPPCDCWQCMETESQNGMSLSGLDSLDLSESGAQERDHEDLEEGLYSGETESTEEAFRAKSTQSLKIRRSFLERQYCGRCNCPELTCLCEFNEVFPLSTSHETGQGMLRCLWVPAVEEWFPEPEVQLPDELTVCPPCSEELECICGELCECEHLFESDRRAMEESSEEGIESDSDAWGPHCELDGLEKCHDQDVSHKKRRFEKGNRPSGSKTSSEVGDAEKDTKDKTDLHRDGDTDGKTADKTPSQVEIKKDEAGRDETPETPRVSTGVTRTSVKKTPTKGAKKKPPTTTTRRGSKKNQGKTPKPIKAVTIEASDSEDSEPDAHTKLLEMMKSSEAFFRPSTQTVEPETQEDESRRTPVKLLCPEIKKKTPLKKPKAKPKPKPCPKAVCTKRCQAQSSQPTDRCDDPWGFGRPHMLF